MTIYNMGDGGKAGTGYSHPFHMHGTHFAVMKVMLKFTLAKDLLNLFFF